MKSALITGITGQDGLFVPGQPGCDFASARRDSLISEAGFQAYNQHE